MSGHGPETPHGGGHELISVQKAHEFIAAGAVDKAYLQAWFEGLLQEPDRKNIKKILTGDADKGVINTEGIDAHFRLMLYLFSLYTADYEKAAEHYSHAHGGAEPPDAVFNNATTYRRFLHANIANEDERRGERCVQKVIPGVFIGKKVNEAALAAEIPTEDKIRAKVEEYRNEVMAGRDNGGEKYRELLKYILQIDAWATGLEVTLTSPNATADRLKNDKNFAKGSAEYYDIPELNVVEGALRDFRTAAASKDDSETTRWSALNKLLKKSRDIAVKMGAESEYTTALNLTTVEPIIDKDGILDLFDKIKDRTNPNRAADITAFGKALRSSVKAFHDAGLAAVWDSVFPGNYFQSGGQINTVDHAGFETKLNELEGKKTRRIFENQETMAGTFHDPGKLPKASDISRKFSDFIANIGESTESKTFGEFIEMVSKVRDGADALGKRTVWDAEFSADYFTKNKLKTVDESDLLAKLGRVITALEAERRVGKNRYEAETTALEDSLKAAIGILHKRKSDIAHASTLEVIGMSGDLDKWVAAIKEKQKLIKTAREQGLDKITPTATAITYFGMKREWADEGVIGDDGMRKAALKTVLFNINLDDPVVEDEVFGIEDTDQLLDKMPFAKTLHITSHSSAADIQTALQSFAEMPNIKSLSEAPKKEELIKLQLQIVLELIAYFRHKISQGNKGGFGPEAWKGLNGAARHSAEHLLDNLKEVWITLMMQKIEMDARDGEVWNELKMCKKLDEYLQRFYHEKYPKTNDALNALEGSLRGRKLPEGVHPEAHHAAHGPLWKTILTHMAAGALGDSLDLLGKKVMGKGHGGGAPHGNEHH